MSQVEPPTGTKGVPIPPLARLAIGTGTKATFCPGAKVSRDKWLRTKTCSVVVSHACHNVLSVLQKHYENADAHTMIEEFREMFENQARYERFNISLVLVCVQVD